MVGILESGSHHVITGICPTTLQKWSTSKETYSMEPPTLLVAPSAPKWAPRPPCWFSLTKHLPGVGCILTLWQTSQRWPLSPKPCKDHKALPADSGQVSLRANAAASSAEGSQFQTDVHCFPVLGCSRGFAVYTACEKDLSTMHNFMTHSWSKDGAKAILHFLKRPEQ